MPRELWVNDNTVARRLRQIWVNDAGVAREIQEVWVNDAGTARLIYQALNVETPNANVVRIGGTPTEYRLENDGNIRVRTGTTLTTVGEWINNPAQVALFEVRATLLSGTFTSGTFGAWQSLSTSRVWTRAANLGNSQTCSMLQEFRNASTSEVVDTSTIFLTCDNS